MSVCVVPLCRRWAEGVWSCRLEAWSVSGGWGEWTIPARKKKSEPARGTCVRLAARLLGVHPRRSRVAWAATRCRTRRVSGCSPSRWPSTMPLPSSGRPSTRPGSRSSSGRSPTRLAPTSTSACRLRRSSRSASLRSAPLPRRWWASPRFLVLRRSSAGAASASNRWPPASTSTRASR